MLHGRFIFRLGVGEWVMMLVEKYGLAMPLWHILGLGHVHATMVEKASLLHNPCHLEKTLNISDICIITYFRRSQLKIIN
jgi:hypothetical protein